MPPAARPEPLGRWYRRRRQAVKDQHPGRESFTEYIRHTTPGYIFGKHLVELIAILEAVERGEEDRVMVIMPPRHGKSLTCSQRFPAWFIGRNPKLEIVHAANTSRLADGFGRRLRNLMRSTVHLDVFPDVGLSPDSQAAGLWHTTQDGVYVAAGTGGAIQGRGGDLIIIDDPIKGRKQADSELERENAWEWYVNDLYSRVHPGCRIVLVCTRWHDDDLAGRLIAAQEDEGDQWKVVHFPAINDEGEALWPEKRSLSYLQRIRRVVTAKDMRAWWSLYQGKPRPELGTYFRKPWFKYGNPPSVEHMQFWGASDLATTQKATSDWSVHVICGIDPDERLWLIDFWRDQTTSDLWVPPWIEMSGRYHPVLWIGERGQIEKSVGPWIDKSFREEGVHQPRELLDSHADKMTKARALQAWMSARGLWMSKAAPFAGVVESELLAFPMGTHDDIVDALALIGRAINMFRKGQIPPPAPPKREGMLTFDDLIKGRGAGLAAGSKRRR